MLSYDLGPYGLQLLGPKSQNRTPVPGCPLHVSSLENQIETQNYKQYLRENLLENCTEPLSLQNAK